MQITWFSMLLIFLSVLIVPQPAGAEYVSATIAVGSNPLDVAVNPVTNKTYVTNFDSQNVTVIDGKTNTAVSVAVGEGPGPHSPGPVAVNTVTNKIYVGNRYSGSVTIIDGATNATTTVAAGSCPIAIAVNPVTNKIYVANYYSANVTVIDGASNTTVTVASGTSPLGVAVNPVTNKIYVTNQDSASVTVIDGSTNATETVAAGSGPGGVAVNPATNKIYVSNYWGNTVTVINGSTNSTSTIAAGIYPGLVAVNPVTNRIYVINGGNNNVAVIDGVTDTVTTLVATDLGPRAISVNPITNRIYVANRGNVSPNVTVIDGDTHSTTTVIVDYGPVALAVNPITNKIYVVKNVGMSVSVIDGAKNATTTIDAGSYPSSIAVNAVTNRMYVTNYLINTVTMIDGATNTTATISTGSHPCDVSVNAVTNKIYVSNYDSNTVTVIDGLANGTTTVAVGANPSGIRVNAVTNKIYVLNNGTNTVTVIDGITNGTSTIVVGLNPTALAVNPVTNKIYVVSHVNNNVTVIDGETNGTATVSVGATPVAVGVNQVTNKIYVANYDSSNVTVIDGSTNATLTVTVGSLPHDVAVNPLTNRIYVTNHGSSSVTVIEGATNGTSTVATGAFPEDVTVNPITNKIYAVNNGSANVTVIDGATNTTATVPAGSSPIAVAVNPATNKIYVANYMSANVTAISEQPAQSIPLTVTITPLEGNVAIVSNPTLSFTTASTYSPIAPAAQNIYYQVDTWTGPWQRATVADNSGSFTIPEQIVGFHTVYAFAGDGQEATSTNRATLIPGSMTAYTFMASITVPGTPTNVTATAGDNSATITFTEPVNHGGRAITGYSVISNPPGGQDSNAGSLDTTHTVTGLNNGTTYTFTVTATNAFGTGPESQASNSVTPPGTIPKPFTFMDQTNATVNTLFISNSILVTGIDLPSPITITGGEYEVNGNGIWSSASGTVMNNMTVRVRQTSSSSYGTRTDTILSIGGVSDTFSVTTLIPDITPDTFVFTDQTNVAVNTLITSNSIIVTGINMPTEVTITGGEYEFNGNGLWSSASGTIVNGNTVRVRQTSSSNYGTMTSTTLTIGGVSDSFSVSTMVSDTKPDQFIFTDQTNVPFNTLVYSNSITVTGINAPAAILPSGGGYEINGNGIWLSASGTVMNGNTVRVRQTSSSSYGTRTDMVLYIGGTIDTFSVTTMVADTTPDPFSFTDQTNFGVNTLATSNSVTITGINAPSPVTIIGGQYEINNSGVWSNASGTVVSGNTVRVRQTSSASNGTKTDTTLTIGGVSDMFSVTTIVFDTSPNPFVFVPQMNVAVNTSIVSNVVTIAGISMPAQVTITGGEYEVNGSGAWSSASGTVVNGNTIRLRQTSSPNYRTKTEATLTIGGISGTYSVTTLSDIGATLSTNLPGPQPSGTLVTVTAHGTGGSNNYEYLFRLMVSGVWTTMQDYSTSNTWRWDTAGYPSGEYRIGVYVRLVGDSAEFPFERSAGYTLYHVGDILTVAGGIGDGAQAALAQLVNPYSIAQDVLGNMYIADYNGNRIRKVDAATGVISTVAGNGLAGYSGDNGPAMSAALNYPSGVALDSAGNIYIVDTHNWCVRKVEAATGVITTVAGNGLIGYSGDNGPATSARVNPMGIAVDSAGNIYIADNYYPSIRKVTSATGIITTVAGNGSGGYTGDNGPAISARLNSPSGIALDGLGNMYIADTLNNRVRKVDAVTGVITTVAGNGMSGYSGDNGAAVSASLYGPFGISVTNRGDIYIADKNNHRIRKVDSATGMITTIAGSGINGYSGDSGPATSASLASPYGVLVDAAGNVLIADTNNARIRRVDVATGVMSSVAGVGGNYAGDNGSSALALLSGPEKLAIDVADNIFVADSSNNRIRKVDAITGVITTVAGNGAVSYTGDTGDNGPATSSYINNPRGVALDMMGNIYIADSGNHRIRKVDALTDVITTVAGTGIGSYSGDNGPATSAMINYPKGITLDNAGNIYIADEYNGRIRKVDSATGVITTVASGLGFPAGVALDLTGNIYIADTNNSRILRVDAITGVMTIVAGNGSGGYSGDTGPAVFATLGYPQGVAVDGTGSIISIVDTNNNRIRNIDTATGVITTVAGNGTRQYSGDNGPALAASINYSYGVALDNKGNVYIADTGNNRIRKVVALVAKPDQFTFVAQTGAPVNTQVISNAMTVTGLNSPAALSIVGGQYEVNGNGVWSSATGTVNNGHSVRVRVMSSSNYSTTTHATLTIGSVSAIFNVTTIGSTTWLLSVSVTGTGTVHTSPGTDLACSTNCGISFSNGTLVNLTAAPGMGYTFSGWTGDPDCTDGTVTMNAAKTCVASFAQSDYLVSTSAGSGGTITPTSRLVSYGRTTAFTVTPNTGYSIGLVSGCSGTLSGNTYTTGAITGACTVTASFTPTQYTVSTSAGTGGTITPTSRLVSYGSTTAFTVTPNTGYSIGLVSGCSGTLSGNTYTTGAITGACTVSATFRAFSAPTTPNLNSPASFSETASRTPMLAVNASTDPNGDPITYTFEVSTTSNFSSIAASVSGISANNGVASWAVSPELSDNTLYYWRALATDGSLNSPWMPMANFFVNTANNKPGDPAVNAPMNNVHVATLTPTLSVTNAVDVDIYDILTYDFDVATDGGFTNIIRSTTGVSQGNGGTTSWTVTPALTEDTPYYWRARARDNYNATSNNWVSAAFFVSATNGGPTAPTVNAPPSAGVVAVFTPVLTVSNATDPEHESLHYAFEIDTVNTFNSTNKQTSGLLAEGANTTSWAPATLTENTTYYWRAKANDGLTDGPWMATASFFVNTVNEPPTAPTLNNPSNNGQVTVLKPTLQVNAATDHDNDTLTYEFEVYADISLVNKIKSTTGANTGWVVDSTLSDNTWYWWRARAKDSHGLAGNWMAASSFFVNNSGYNDPPTIKITKPGAAEPVFYGGIYSIQWTAADPDSSATITLGYDTTGTTNCDGTQIATGITEHDGSDSYNWNITNLAQGTYYIYAKITDGTTTVCEYSASPLTKNNSSGDMNGDGIVDITDALWALRIAAGLIQPTPADIAHADVAPIVNGVPQADGVIDIRDVVVILRKAAGLVTW